MEETQTMNDPELSELMSTPYEIPYSVEVVLRKVETAEMDRARRDIRARLQVILTSVNVALYRMTMSKAAGEQEEEQRLSVKEQQKKRGQLLMTLKDFLLSSVDKEKNLEETLQWLKDINNELLEVDEDKVEVESVTEEWVEDMQRKIQSSMSDIQGCIVHLHQLCGLLFDLDTKKKKKKEGGINKGGVWRWWRESKVDARTILKIQEQQPPSVEKLLEDPTQGMISAFDLGLMLGDMAKFLSCNKTMSMAFRFAQMGLTNLSEALQERTRVFNQSQAELDALKAMDAQTHLTRAQAELQGMKKRVAMLEGENQGLKEKNDTHVSRIHQIQEAHRKPSPPIVVEQLVEIPMPVSFCPEISAPTPSSARSKPPKRRAPPKKQDRVTEAPVVSEPERPDTSPGIPEFKPVIPDYCQEGAPDDPVSISDQEDRPGPEPVPEDLDILEATEPKSSSDLLSDFQSSIFTIVDTSLNLKPGDAVGGMELEEDKINKAMKLYITLQKTIKDSFSQLNTKLHGKLTDHVPDDELEHSGFWVETSKCPDEMPKKVKPKHKQKLESMDSTSHHLPSNKRLKSAHSEAPQKSVNQLSDPVSEVTGHLKNTHHTSKQQASQLSLLLCDDPQSTEMIYDQTEQRSDSSHGLEEEPQEEQLPLRHPEQRSPPRAPPPRRSLMPLPRQSISLPRQGSTRREDLYRYQAQMEEESARIERTVMASATYHVGVVSQKTNLSLLRKAVVGGNISRGLYLLAKDLITHARSLVLVRLVCLLQRFTAFKSLQQVKYNLNMQLLAARGMKDGKTVKDMYCFLTRLDKYQNLMLARWNARLAKINQARRTCLARMIYLFKEMSQDCSLHLVPPVCCPTEPQLHFLTVEMQPRRIVSAFSPRRRHRPRGWSPSSNQTVTGGSGVGPLSGVRELLRGQLPAVWSGSLTMNNMQLAGKQPAGPAYLPCIPRLLEMDINHSRQAALCSSLEWVAEEQELLASGDI